ncbi:hypothetical protein DFR33_102228 [Bradymonas sediminis]|nr:hypothetical protein DFR33_102228 [Bradymonas sediminis]
MMGEFAQVGRGEMTRRAFQGFLKPATREPR